MKKISIYIWGNFYTFNKKVLNRKKIYGEKKIVPLDKEGQECKRGYLNENGNKIYLSDCYSYCKLDDNGQYKQKEKSPATDEGFVRFRETDDISQLSLLFMPNQVYVLEGEESYSLAFEIKDKIFSSYHFSNSNFSSYYDQIIFQRNGNLFLIEKSNAYEKHIEFISKEDDSIYANLPFILDSVNEISFEDL
jgi:hypothetical protein